MAARKKTSTVPTQDSVYSAAAALFSARGFDGVSMDDIAGTAGVNKAMIYYHFADKLTLYRSIVGDGLRTMAGIVRDIVAQGATPTAKLNQFVESFVRMTEQRPWMPAMMLREIAEGAPRLDADTLVHMQGIVGGFAAILQQGQHAGVFRQIHPLLAYESIVGPIIINAARERVAAQPHRRPNDLPLLVSISHDDLIAHSQEAARRMLTP